MGLTKAQRSFVVILIPYHSFNDKSNFKENQFLLLNAHNLTFLKSSAQEGNNPPVSHHNTSLYRVHRAGMPVVVLPVVYLVTCVPRVRVYNTTATPPPHLNPRHAATPEQRLNNLLHPPHTAPPSRRGGPNVDNKLTT